MISFDKENHLSIRKKEKANTCAQGHGFEIFDYPEALEINRARQEHLASLGLDLVRKRVLEVGSGVGWHTGFFEKLGCTIISTDARPENVAEHLRRYPYRKGRVEVADLNILGSHTKFGKFDIVYCYGTLYHLSNPDLCIRDLADSCEGTFLLETLVNSVDNNEMNKVAEDSSGKNQSFDGIGCRPARNWIMSELKKYYSYVYVTRSQPNNPEFPTDWSAAPDPAKNYREVFVAAKKDLRLSSLSKDLMMMQLKLPDLLENPEPISERS